MLLIQHHWRMTDKPAPHCCCLAKLIMSIVLWAWQWWLSGQMQSRRGRRRWQRSHRRWAWRRWTWRHSGGWPLVRGGCSRTRSAAKCGPGSSTCIWITCQSNSVSQALPVASVGSAEILASDHKTNCYHRIPMALCKTSKMLFWIGMGVSICS